MTSVLFCLFILFLALCALLNLVSLPGNWIMAASVAAYAFLAGASSPELIFYPLFFGSFFLGEAAEFFLQLRGAKKGGASRRSAWLSMAGALLGALLCAPFLFGLGAVPGALTGAWAACWLSERFLSGRTPQEALHAAKCTFSGRLLGMIIKFGAGISMVCLAAAYL